MMKGGNGDDLRQAVFGANDGLVSTFGLVAGLVGAEVPPTLLIVASIISMFAAGMSMGLGSYISTKSQVEANKHLITIEREYIRSNPRSARKTLERYLRKREKNKAMYNSRLQELLSNEREWIHFVIEEKHGLGKAAFPNPVRGGAIMFFAFLICGFVPIVPLFLASGSLALAFSAFLTAITLFAVGAMKEKVTGKSWTSLGLENLIIGAITGLVGFLAGVVSSKMFF